ncbi:MAG: phenylacetate--CoA ligase family protein [Gammaproteobacteria bacterium]|nr:phenylacetate--CoA ligase family protein [Gammaproteobacteria bacterium]
MAGNRKSRRKKKRPPAVVRYKAKGGVTTTGPGPPPRVEGVLWPPIFTGGKTSHLLMQVQYEISQWWEPERILFHQLAQLRSLMVHAAKTTPFYKDRLEQALDYSLGRDLDLSTFRKIPILTRSEFQDAGNSINSTAIPASHGAPYAIRTSGSTGEPLALKATDVTATYQSAMNLRYHLWHRRDFSQKLLAFRTVKPGEPTRRVAPSWGPVVRAGKSITVSMAQPGSALLEVMKAEDPGYLVVHPSVLNELLYLSREQGFQPANLKEVLTLGEILYPELRERCQRQWNVQVIDNYSCVEFGSLALQCPEHSHYHVQSECALIEVLRPDNTPCEPGEVGKVVASSLSNFATPMLRYENGDMAEVGESCPCGRGLPVLKRIIGRVRNMAVLPNGERLMLNLATGSWLFDLPIKHFQLVQKTTELIEARLVVDRALTTAEETALVENFNKGWRHQFNFSFAYPDDIARGANGKYEVFRCEVPLE